MRITIVINSVAPGGAERAMTIMSNYWAAKEWKITLLTFDDGKQKPFYTLSKSIKHIPLNLFHLSPNPFIAILNNFSRIKILHSAIHKSEPDIVISFLEKTNIITILATCFLKIPIVVVEQIDPAMHFIGKTWELLRRWTYPLADSTVVLTEGAKKYFASWLGKKTHVIPNPVILTPQEELVTDDTLVTKPCILAVGRLTYQKGFDLLLQAFSNLKNIYPQWNLMILGEGELRLELEALCNCLGLSDRVYLPGVVENVYDFMKQADIFVMSSRYEGFGMVLCEAMVCGLPVISTNCPSGPSEIIRHEIDGILIPTEDVDALTKAMDRLMSNEDERQRFGSRAPEITERFGIDKVMKEWENLLEEVIAELPFEKNDESLA